MMYIYIYIRGRPKPKLPGRNQEPNMNKVPGSGHWFWDFGPSWLLVLNFLFPGWNRKLRPYYWSNQEVAVLTRKFLVSHGCSSLETLNLCLKTKIWNQSCHKFDKIKCLMFWEQNIYKQDLFALIPGLSQ